MGEQKANVRVATTAAVTLNYYGAGTPTLPAQIDGVWLNIGDRILNKNDTLASSNGFFTVTGYYSTTALTRSAGLALQWDSIAPKPLTSTLSNEPNLIDGVNTVTQTILGTSNAYFGRSGHVQSVGIDLGSPQPFCKFILCSYYGYTPLTSPTGWVDQCPFHVYGSNDNSAWTYLETVYNPEYSKSTSSRLFIYINFSKVYTQYRYVKLQSPTEHQIKYSTTDSAAHAPRELNIYYPNLVNVVRSTDADTSEEVTSGTWCLVDEGTANAGKAFFLTTADPIVLGTTSLTFEEEKMIASVETAGISDSMTRTVESERELTDTFAVSDNLHIQDMYPVHEDSTAVSDEILFIRETEIYAEEPASVKDSVLVEYGREFTFNLIQLIRIDEKSNSRISESEWTEPAPDYSAISDSVSMRYGLRKYDPSETAGINDAVALYKTTKPGSDGTEDGSGIIEEPEYDSVIAKYFIPGELELKAVPETGNAFVLWEVNGAVYSGETVEDFDDTIQDGDTITAVFKQNYTCPTPPAPDKNLSITISPSGSGKVYTPYGLSTGAGSTVTLPSGEAVLFAVTDSRNTYEFSHWTGDLTGTGNPSEITMSGAKAVTAVFAKKQYAVSVTVSPSSGAGTVTGGGVTVPAGDTVTLTASPATDTDYEFYYWSGDIEGNENPLSLTVTENLNIEAVFYEPENWLVRRLTEIKRNTSRWVEFAEAIQTYWEQSFDPAFNALQRMMSFFSASLRGKKRILSDLSGHYFETAFNPDDLPLYYTERRVELMRRGQEGAISAALQKINPDVPVVLEQMCVRKYDLEKDRQGFFYFPDEIADASDRVYIPRYALRLNGCLLPFNSTDEWSALFRHMKPLYIAYGESAPLYTGEIQPHVPECDFIEAAQLFYTEKFYGSDGAGIVSCYENQDTPSVYFYMSDFSSDFQSIEMDIVYDTFGIEGVECQSILTGASLEVKKTTATYGETSGTISGTEKIILTCSDNGVSENFDGRIFSLKPKMKAGKSGVLSVVNLSAVVSDKTKKYDIADGGFGFAGQSGLGSENSADIIFVSKTEDESEIIGKSIMDGFEPYDPENLFFYFSSKGLSTQISLRQSYEKSNVYLRLDGNIPRDDFYETHINLEDNTYAFSGKTGVFYIYRKDEPLRGYYSDDVKLLLEKEEE